MVGEDAGDGLGLLQELLDGRELREHVGLVGHRAEATAWLEAQADSGARPAVVYLDPMFAEAGKAQVKKEMQACRALAGAPADAPALLAAARAAAGERVVVKRHPQHRPLADDVSFEVRGDRVRFDVYLSA